MHLIEPDDIDFTAYYEMTDTTHKVREANVWLDEIVEDTINPPTEQVCAMPWSKTRLPVTLLWMPITVHGRMSRRHCL